MIDLNISPNCEQTQHNKHHHTLHRTTRYTDRDSNGPNPTNINNKDQLAVLLLLLPTTTVQLLVLYTSSVLLLLLRGTIVNRTK